MRFVDIKGHQKPRRLVEKAMLAGRMPHAYLFKGPDGVGKRSFALALAATIACRRDNVKDACGECSSCRKFISGNHPDISSLRPENGRIKIDQIRSLIAELAFPPYESQFRTVILEDVHTMRREAANSLLKTLEEPPQGNLLLLTADSSMEVLPTIVSRCQVLAFSHLTLEDTQNVLKSSGLVEGVELLARLSEGSPGRALEYHNAAMLGLLRELVGYLEKDEQSQGVRIQTILEFSQEMASLKERLPIFLGLLKVWLRDMLAGTQSFVNNLNNNAALLKSWSSDELFARLQAVNLAEKQLQYNCNRQAVCEVLLFRLC